MYHGGIDAHATYLMIAIVDNIGQRVMAPTRVRSRESERLLELLRPWRPLEVVVEASPFWPWLHDLVVAEGIGFVLAHAKRLRAIAEADQKDDAVDAELLARMLAAGLIPATYPRPAGQREWVRLVRHRAVLVRQRTALWSRIHAQLHQVGLSYPRSRLKTRVGRQWLSEQAGPRLSAEQQRLIGTHLELIETLGPMVRALDRRIVEVGAAIPEVALLRTIPGLGPYYGLLLAAELVPMERFAQAEKLVSYAGLAPRTRSSGGRTRHGSIPAGANRWVRGALVKVVVAHRRHAPESWLSAYYERQSQRVGWRVARVATARRLTHVVYAMLRAGEPWRGASASTGRDELRATHAAMTASDL